MKTRLRTGLFIVALTLLPLAENLIAQPASQSFDLLAYGAKCDGKTPDYKAIRAALSAAAAVRGTVISPPGRSCIVEKPLLLDNFIGVKVVGGIGTTPLPGNRQSIWNFTSTCTQRTGGPCLSMRSTMAVSFQGIQLSFPNAVSGPMVDLSHSSSGRDSSLITFDGVSFSGPGKSVGPIVLDQNTDAVAFTGWTSFSNASVFVEGPVSNAAGFSDKTVFDRVVFSNPGLAAIQNASVAWTISNSIFQIFLPGSRCVPALQYVNGYSYEQALLVSGNVVNSTGGNCINTFSVFTLPDVSENSGGATFSSNLFIPGTVAGHQTEISVGRNQAISITGNIFNHIGVAVSAGPDVSIDMGPNVYSDVTTQVHGAPFASRSVRGGRESFVYTGVRVGPGAPITSSGYGGTTASVLASGTTRMSTDPIGSGACGAVMTANAPGVRSIDAISFSFSEQVGPNPGVLIVHSWPTQDRVNFVYCNPTTMSVTPPFAVLNWRVTR